MTTPKKAQIGTFSKHNLAKLKDQSIRLKDWEQISQSDLARMNEKIEMLCGLKNALTLANHNSDLTINYNNHEYNATLIYHQDYHYPIGFNCQSEGVVFFYYYDFNKKQFVLDSNVDTKSHQKTFVEAINTQLKDHLINRESYKPVFEIPDFGFEKTKDLSGTINKIQESYERTEWLAVTCFRGYDKHIDDQLAKEKKSYSLWKDFVLSSTIFPLGPMSMKYYHLFCPNFYVLTVSWLSLVLKIASIVILGTILLFIACGIGLIGLFNK